MAPSKVYNVGLANKKHTKSTITRADATTPTYEQELEWFTKEIFSKSTNHSIVLRSVNTATKSDSESPIVGVVDLPFVSLSNPIQICFGDPDSSPKTAVWESLFCREILKTSGFELSVDLGGNLGRRVFDWKRTHDIAGMGVLKRELDFLHLKMVDRETGQVLAKFTHHMWYGEKRGVLEIEEFDGGADWDLIVVLSGMAVLEYLRKLSGYSF